MFDTQIAAMALGQGEQSRLLEPSRPVDGHPARQGRTIYRLVAPSARQASNRLCHCRRNAFVGDISNDVGKAEGHRSRRVAQ